MRALQSPHLSILSQPRLGLNCLLPEYGDDGDDGDDGGDGDDGDDGEDYEEEEDDDDDEDDDDNDDDDDDDYDDLFLPWDRGEERRLDTRTLYL